MKYPSLSALLADPARWCQNAPALDSSLGDGEAVDPKSPNARAWCLLGAIDALSTTSEIAQRASEAAALVIRGDATIAAVRVVLWNDAPKRSHADILRVAAEVDRAMGWS